MTAVAALTLAAAFVTACGSSDDNSSTSSPGTATTSGTSSSLAAQVPAAIRKRGTLRVAADATYPPNEFLASDGHTVQGMDAELVDAIAKKLGLKAKVSNATFASIIPGLQAGKYDMGASSFTDSKEREKVVDFVTYFTAGTSFFVKADGGAAINTLDDLCGHVVAAETGTVQADAAQAQSKKCEAAGKPAVKVLTFPDQNGANLALSSGRAEVGMADSPVAEYQVKKSGGQFKISGKPYGTAPYGLAFAKKSGLIEPVRAALKELIADGTYQAILEKWGIETGAISDPQVDGATS